MAFETLETKHEGFTYTITLNRPDKLNALNQQLLDELESAFVEASENDEVRGILLTGAGGKAFAAGADIGEFQGLDAQKGEALSRRGQELFDRIESSRKPVLAAVNGYALGGGCELAMACHMRVASENAIFGQPEVKLGILAGYGGTQRLMRYVGPGKAIELLTTGATIDAPEAHRLGLVNHLTTRGELIEACYNLLGKIYKMSPLAVAYTLEAVTAGLRSNKGYETERRNFGRAIVSDDASEGTRAFLEKRKANFTGK